MPNKLMDAFRIEWNDGDAIIVSEITWMNKEFHGSDWDWEDARDNQITREDFDAIAFLRLDEPPMGAAFSFLPVRYCGTDIDGIHVFEERSLTADED